MTASEPIRCPQCGTRRVMQAEPLDLCPACLLANALSIDDEPCPYEVMTPMSKDAGGVTYLARALNGGGGHVALKMCAPRDDVETILSRYRRWQPALARVRHPSIGKLLDIGVTAEGRLYVASVYVPGWPLTAHSSRGPLGRSERVELARQLTGAVDAAHAADVVHLKLDASKVKVSTAHGLHATILGLGSGLIVDGADGPPDLDRLALARIMCELGLEP